MPLTGDERLHPLAAAFGLPVPTLAAPGQKRVQPSAALAGDPDGLLTAAVFHTFSRNAIAKVLLLHDDMAAAQAVYAPLGLWGGGKRNPADTGAPRSRAAPGRRATPSPTPAQTWSTWLPATPALLCCPVAAPRAP